MPLLKFFLCIQFSNFTFPQFPRFYTHTHKVPVNLLKKIKDTRNRASSQGGGIGRYTVPPCTTRRRTTTNLKSKKQPELPENRTVWKSNNQGVKEETLIQNGRRDGDEQLGQIACMARWWMEDLGDQGSSRETW